MLQHTFEFLLLRKHKIFLLLIFAQNIATKFNAISQYFWVPYISAVTVAYVAILLWPLIRGSG